MERLYKYIEITDLKDMLKKSGEKYGEKIAYKIRQENEYKEITHSEVRKMVDGLGTKLIDMGLKDKRIAVIGENRYEWEIAYLSIVCGTGTVVPLDKSLPENELESLIERSAADEDKGHSRFLRRGSQVLGDLTMDAGRLPRGEAAGVGQYKEQPIVALQAGAEGLLRPIGIYTDVMDGLHAGGVVIQNDDLSVKAAQLLPQRLMHGISIRRGPAVQQGDRLALYGSHGASSSDVLCLNFLGADVRHLAVDAVFLYATAAIHHQHFTSFRNQSGQTGYGTFAENNLYRVTKLKIIHGPYFELKPLNFISVSIFLVFRGKSPFIIQE